MTYALDKKVNMGEYPGYMKVNYLGPAAVVEEASGRACAPWLTRMLLRRRRERLAASLRYERTTRARLPPSVPRSESCHGSLSHHPPPISPQAWGWARRVPSLKLLGAGACL